MNAPPKRGSAGELGAANHPLPRDSLTISEPRELLVLRSAHAAFEPDGSLARDTPHTISLPGFVRPFPLPDPPTDGDVVRVHEAEVLWGGNLADQFGHFLTESVGRLWPLLPGGELEGLPVVFTTPREVGFVREWLQAFGVETVELPEQGAVRFTRMLVPEAVWRLDNWIAPEIRDIHLRARRGLDLPAAPGDDVVWLSRLKLDNGRVPQDERLLEWVLGDRVRSICPETMALGEQVAALEGCRGVAGVIGSAFHALLMVEDLPASLYLCPPWDKGTFPAQHRLLDADATFSPALEIISSTRSAREREIFFPRGYRLLIPETLRALSETLLPALLDDPRIARFADPAKAGPSAETGLDRAVERVLVDPHSVDARAALAGLFEAEGLAECAREQQGMIHTLTEPLSYP